MNLVDPCQFPACVHGIPDCLCSIFPDCLPCGLQDPASDMETALQRLLNQFPQLCKQILCNKFVSLSIHLSSPTGFAFMVKSWLIELEKHWSLPW